MIQTLSRRWIRSGEPPALRGAGVIFVGTLAAALAGWAQAPPPPASPAPPPGKVAPAPVQNPTTPAKELADAPKPAEAPKPAPVPEGPQPSVEVAGGLTFDFGSIWPDDPLKHTFVLTNKGKAELSILKVQPG
jgi:hypothetical protein